MHQAELYKLYVDLIGQGDITRAEAAEHFGVHKSTATYHLERAVAEGDLERFYSYTRANQTGWAYRLRDGAQRSFYDVDKWERMDDTFTPIFERSENPLSLIGG